MINKQTLIKDTLHSYSHGRLRLIALAIMSFVLLFSLFPGMAYADDALQDPPELPKLPKSNLSADFVSKVITISPKSGAGLNLTVNGASRDEDAAIVAKKKKSGGEQRFEILKDGDNTYIIRSAHSGRLITERDGKIIQTGLTKAKSDDQRWAITKKSGGYIFTNAVTADRLSAPKSKSKSKAVPAGAASKVTKAQIFTLKVSPVTLDGYYLFDTQAGNAISLSKDSLKNGTGMVLKKNAEKSVGRQFFLISSSNGYHVIKNSISFKALDIKGGSKKAGTKLIQNEYNKKKNQRFRLVPSGDGWYLLKSALGPYVSAASDNAKAKIVTTNTKAQALKVHVTKTEYSTGNLKLDKKVKKFQKKVGFSGDTMKKSYKYLVKNYRHIEHPNNFKGDWISRYADYMFTKKHGHCKNFAATLCVIYRAYGYDARVVTGLAPSRSRGMVTHGWVEVKIKGKTYICDADLQVQSPTHDWYKRTYANNPCLLKVQKRW
jgi:hypothetical protein